MTDPPSLMLILQQPYNHTRSVTEKGKLKSQTVHVLHHILIQKSIAKLFVVGKYFAYCCSDMVNYQQIKLCRSRIRLCIFYDRNSTERQSQ